MMHVIDTFQTKEELKAYADSIGLSYSNNIGFQSLKEKIEEFLETESEQVTADVEESTPQSVVTKKEETLPERYARYKAEQLRLIRCSIQVNDPMKQKLPGDFITVINKYTKKVTKYIPFGDGAQEYHVPKIIFDELKSRKYQHIPNKRSGKNNWVANHDAPQYRNTYTVTELPPLTPEELDALAIAQVRSKAID